MFRHVCVGLLRAVSALREIDFCAHGYFCMIALTGIAEVLHSEEIRALTGGIAFQDVIVVFRIHEFADRFVKAQAVVLVDGFNYTLLYDFVGRVRSVSLE